MALLSSCTAAGSYDILLTSILTSIIKSAMQKLHLDNMHSWIDMCKNRCEQWQCCLARFLTPYAGLRHLKCRLSVAMMIYSDVEWIQSIQC